MMNAEKKKKLSICYHQGHRFKGKNPCKGNLHCWGHQTHTSLNLQHQT